MLSNFWRWYEKNYKLNILIFGGLFFLQIIHLYWLATDVIAFKLWGVKWFPISDFWQTILIFVDYTEIPALLGTSLIYFNEIRKKFNYKSAVFIILLLSQFLHIFWITDEFVVDTVSGIARETILPAWLAWVAILIDYGEVPIIFDTMRRIIKAFKGKDITKVAEVLKNK